MQVSEKTITDISIKIAQAFYPYGDNVWNVVGKNTKEKCERLTVEIISMINEDKVN